VKGKGQIEPEERAVHTVEKEDDILTAEVEGTDENIKMCNEKKHALTLSSNHVYMVLSQETL